MKALTDETGLYAKPVNKYRSIFTGNSYNLGNTKEFWDFDKQFPSRPLTMPQQPNSVIEVGPEAIWQFKLKADKWVNSSDHESDIKHRFETRQVYEVVEQIKENDNCLICNGTGERFSEKLVQTWRCDHCNGTGRVDYNTTPELKEVAEKETVDIKSIATNHFSMTGYHPNDDYKSFVNGFVACANWQSTQGNKRIVEVIEKRIKSLREILTETVERTTAESRLLFCIKNLTDLLTQIRK